VGNAIKFTDRGEVALDVACEAQDESSAMLHFVVRDTGIGIPEHKQRVIFAAFAQADGSTTRKFGGTGLGLTISASLIELMGGRMWVESAEGQGSRFHFTARVGLGKPARLSASAGAEKTVRRAGVYSNPGFERARSILLAEDNEVNRLLVVRLLERQGYRVVIAENGRQAVAALDREAVDLVLMDVQMPEMDGVEATRAIRLREKETGGHLPIIALTAHAMKGDRECCLEAGMDDYLSKPVRPQHLFTAIEAQLLLSRAQKDSICELAEEAPRTAAELATSLSRP
jgi:CheY-like chemotaxis protein